MAVQLLSERRLHKLFSVYSCQNATLLEITCHSSNEKLTAIVVNGGKRVDYGKCSKILNTFLFLFSNKTLVLGLEFIKCLSE